MSEIGYYGGGEGGEEGVVVVSSTVEMVMSCELECNCGVIEGRCWQQLASRRQPGPRPLKLRGKG